MFIETCSGNPVSEDVFSSYKRTYIFEITNTTFYLNRLSILTNGSKKSTGGF